MFLYCCLIFCFFDSACLFPLYNCDAKFRNIFAILDFQSELQEQKIFLETFGKYLQNNTRNKQEILIHYDILPGFNIDSLNEFHRFETLSNYFKESSNKSRTCNVLNIVFIFLYNITDINNNSNPMINHVVDVKSENKAYNIFFIIQSSENPNNTYASLNFIHFTSSIEDLNIIEIVHTICYIYTETNRLVPNMSTEEINYIIINRSLEISFNEASCYCDRKHGMKILSLETYQELDYLIPSFYSLTEFNTSEIHIYISLKSHSKKISGNPITFVHPSQILSINTVCFYLNFSEKVAYSILGYYELYDLGKYMVEIDCYKTLKHSFVACERSDFLTETYFKNLPTKSISTVSDKDTFIHLYDLRKVFYTYISFNACDSKSHHYSTSWGINHCVHYLDKKNNNNKINAFRNSHITLIIQGQYSFYIFAKVNISKCVIYNNYQNISSNKPDNEIFNPNVDNYYCANCKVKKKFNQTCLIRTVNSNFTLEYVQCKSDKSQYSLRCIKYNYNQCKDKSHLRNCENYICPESLFKCMNSYCILKEMINDGEKDCIQGEDESHRKPFYVRALCVAYLTIAIQDICLDFNTFNNILPTIGNSKQFLCDSDCPKNYKCVSSKIKEKSESRSEYKVYQYQMATYLYRKLSEGIIFMKNVSLLTDFFTIISFKGSYCKMNNFDVEFQYWNFDKLIVLDISDNYLYHCAYLNSIKTFTMLKVLNLSLNNNLVIDESFNFPTSLETIDLSHTKTKALRYQIFGNLKNLRHLNLSNTLITKLKDMGLPEFFTLDTLYMDKIHIEDIDTNLFKGLTINYELVAGDYVICCPQILKANISDEKCYAPIDFISSCKHLVGDTFKRVVIWIVGLLTIIGNGIVLVYRIGWNREIFKKAYGLFITGLAISDFIMGIYLMIIAIVDIYYKDVYVLDEFNWRNSFLCNLCGFLSTLSSEVSTFFICLITLDRFFCITYPFGEHRFSKTGKILSFTLVWLIALVLAFIPIVLSDWEIYSSNGLCLALPLSPKQDKKWAYSFVVFVCINFLLFLIIAIGQLTIFINLIRAKKSFSFVGRDINRKYEELSVAKKLAFVAFSDFCCWFPVGILGFLSLNGYIFNREVYAWIAVFVLPINSALNPIIYTIPAVYGKYNSIRKVNSITLQSKL